MYIFFKGVQAGLYPSVGPHSKGAYIEVNFGQEPFAFDIEAYNDMNKC